MTKSFEKALQSDATIILDSLKNPNPFACTQTISLLLEYEVFAPEFVQAVSELEGDERRALFDETVSDVAKRYLFQARRGR